MILLTGGLGTIGRPLTRQLRQNGHTVVVCGVEHSALPQYERVDVGDFRQLQRVVRQYGMGEGDVVYHLAAEFGRKNGEDFYEQCWRTNVIGTKHLIRLQEKYRFRVIFASSSEVYGELPEGEAYDEGATERCPLVHYNDYAISKWVNEQQFRNSIKQHGTETMILRFFNAYGPGEIPHPYRSVVSLFVHAALTNTPFNVFKDYWRAFMYVEDFVPTLARAVDRFHAGETINVGGREYTNVMELAWNVIARTGASPKLMHIVDRREHNVVSKRPVIDKAISLLDHDPRTTLDEGLPPTIEWMRARMKETQ